MIKLMARQKVTLTLVFHSLDVMHRFGHELEIVRVSSSLGK